MREDFTYHRQGRNPRTALVLVLIWLALALGWVVLEAAPWVLIFLALFTLPAVWDYVTDPPSGLRLTQKQLEWHSGKRAATVMLDEIDHIAMNTRLDFSVKTTVVLLTGAKLRLPFEATPPTQPLEEAFNERGIKVRRTHFQLMQ